MNNNEIEKMNERKPYVIACIPAYNEERSIAAVILEAEKHVDKIIVCDDGSTDHTAQIAERMGATVIKHEKNMGYGAAITTLLRKALELGADIAITLDADGQHNPNQIPQLVKPIIEGKADIVIGSRFLQTLKEKIPTYRKLGIKTITRLANITTKLGITDAQSGYRAYSQKALQNIAPKLTETGMGVSLQILEIASQANLKITETPITIRYDVEKPSKKNPLAHGAELLMTLIKLVALERPLIYIGIPSAASLITGIALTTYLIWLFNQTRYFSVPIALIALGALFLGTILATSAITFHALITISKKLEQGQNPRTRGSRTT